MCDCYSRLTDYFFCLCTCKASPSALLLWLVVQPLLTPCVLPTTVPIVCPSVKLSVERNSVQGIHFRIPVSQQRLLGASKGGAKAGAGKPAAGKSKGKAASGEGSGVAIPGMITLVTQRDGMRFTTPQLRVASQSYLAVVDEYSAAQTEVQQQIMEVVATYADILATAVEVIDAACVALFPCCPCTACNGFFFSLLPISTESPAVLLASV